MQIMKLSFSLLFQKQNSVHIQYFSLNEKDDSFEYERIETSSPLYNSFCIAHNLYNRFWALKQLGGRGPWLILMYGHLGLTQEEALNPLNKNC